MCGIGGRIVGGFVLARILTRPLVMTGFVYHKIGL
jgi:hypothetical protein